MGALDGILELASEESYQQTQRIGRTHDYEQEVLAFSLGDEEYAVDILRVREILKMIPITEVPRTPSFVAGIVSVRGVVVPVLDLRARIGLSPAPVTKSRRILHIHHGEESFGLIVDAVHQVVRLVSEEVEATPHTLGGIEEFVVGIGRPGAGRMLIMLNVEAVLSFSVRMGA